MEEIKKLVAALKKADRNENLNEQDNFYVNIFQFFANGPAGQKIVMMLTDSNDSCDFTYIRIMKKFSKNFNINIHAKKLLEKVFNGIVANVSPVEYTELLVKEVLPLMMHEPLELPTEMIYRLLLIVFKYYISNFYNYGEKRHLADESRVKLLEFFNWIGMLLKWEPFPYNSTWSKDLYWQKLKQIENTTCDSKQIFYLTCYLFFISAQDYLESTKVKIDGHEIQYILVEGLSDEIIAPPLMNILHEKPFHTDTLTSFLTAVKAQDLLRHNVMFYQDFNKILFELNIAGNINRLVIDFAIYLRSNTDTYNLISPNNTITNLEKNIRMLSLVTNNVNSTRETFDYIRSIITDLPSCNGSFLKNLTPDRSLLFLPLTKHAIVQYCTRVIVTCLKRKAFKESGMAKTIDDFQLGSLLVLLQLEFYDNIPLVEHIFEIIRLKGLDFPLFSSYIVNIEMIEEFLSIYRAGEVKLKLCSTAMTPTTQRRIGTRGESL